MASNKFKSGDRVQHVSGGPIMVVDRYIGATSQISCKWWSEKINDFESTEFNEDALIKVDA